MVFLAVTARLAEVPELEDVATFPTTSGPIAIGSGAIRSGAEGRPAFGLDVRLVLCQGERGSSDAESKPGTCADMIRTGTSTGGFGLNPRATPVFDVAAGSIFCGGIALVVAVAITVA